MPGAKGPAHHLEGLEVRLRVLGGDARLLDFSLGGHVLRECVVREVAREVSVRVRLLARLADAAHAPAVRREQPQAREVVVDAAGRARPRGDVAAQDRLGVERPMTLDMMNEEEAAMYLVRRCRCRGANASDAAVALAGAGRVRTDESPEKRPQRRRERIVPRRP